MTERPTVAKAPEVDQAAGAPKSSRLESVRARARDRRTQLEEARATVPVVDAGFELVERDSAIAGGILAGALAYRIFIWLLPLALVLVGGLGVLSDMTGRSPSDVADEAGLTGLVTVSVASAASSSARWYALIFGIAILLYTTRSLLRAFVAVHRLAWGERATGSPPSLKATLAFLAFLVAVFAGAALARAIRVQSEAAGLVVALLILAVYLGAWLALSVRLPHAAVGWQALLPGAVLFAVGMQAFHLFTVYFLADYASSKQGTYGALGLAAALLFGLYLVGRLVIASAVLNATLHDRRLRRPAR